MQAMQGTELCFWIAPWLQSIKIMRRENKSTGVWRFFFLRLVFIYLSDEKILWFALSWLNQKPKEYYKCLFQNSLLSIQECALSLLETPWILCLPNLCETSSSLLIWLLIYNQNSVMTVSFTHHFIGCYHRWQWQSCLNFNASRIQLCPLSQLLHLTVLSTIRKMT